MYYQAGPPLRDLYDEHLKKHPSCCAKQYVRCFILLEERHKLPLDKLMQWSGLVGPIMHTDIQSKSSMGDSYKKLFGQFSDRLVKLYNSCVQCQFDGMKDIHFSSLFSTYPHFFIMPDFLTHQQSMTPIFAKYNPDFLTDFCNAVRHVLDPTF